MLYILVTLLSLVQGHGHATFPASFRHGGSVELAGDCTNGACFWFSNNVEIPGSETLPREYRTVLRDALGRNDIFKTSPWRAPGTAPVFGSGCGSAGGGPTYYANGGNPPKGIDQGMDGIDLPSKPSVQWTRGSVQEVAWAVSANHGGGYAYRLCTTDGNVTEECFQQNHLEFTGAASILYSDGHKVAFNSTIITEGTYPAGSQWAMSPVPGCKVCTDEQYISKCGYPLDPVPGKVKSDWDNQVNCYAMCDGAGDSKSSGACVAKPNYPEVVKGISGFGKSVYDWSIADEVKVPKDLPTGQYLLSWRWDCEESTQVWQNCADITIV